MKPFHAFFISAHIGASISAVLDTAVLKCGSLGALNIENVPVNVNVTNLRSCEAHPLDLKIATSNTSSVADTNLRLGAARQSSCYTKAPYGCDTGYCWKACGNTEKGEWCWLADNNGWGNWLKCSSWTECNTNVGQCGQGCKVSSSCGCSC